MLAELRMEFPRPDAWLAHRVSYGETDAMGVLYHAEYIHIFERSRGELGRACRCGYKFIEEQGIMLPVREVQCRYRIPARYDDLLQVHVAVAEWKRASVRFCYEIRDETKKTVLAEGMTLHACANMQGKPVPVPSWLKTAFSEAYRPVCPAPAVG
jgi:acyl-CoA thioester hydrolase